MVNLSRLDIVLVDLKPTRGSEIKKTRPCVIISPNIVNKHSKTVIICAITHYDTKKSKSHFFVTVSATKTTGLTKKSVINSLQTRTIDRTRIIKKLGKLPKSLERSLDYAIALATGTDRNVKKC
jgi:mRNA interferase MazF